MAIFFVFCLGMHAMCGTVYIPHLSRSHRENIFAADREKMSRASRLREHIGKIKYRCLLRLLYFVAGSSGG